MNKISNDGNIKNVKMILCNSCHRSKVVPTKQLRKKLKNIVDNEMHKW